MPLGPALPAGRTPRCWKKAPNSGPQGHAFNSSKSWAGSVGTSTNSTIVQLSSSNPTGHRGEGGSVRQFPKGPECQAHGRVTAGARKAAPQQPAVMGKAGAWTSVTARKARITLLNMQAICRQSDNLAYAAASTGVCISWMVACDRAKHCHLRWC